MTEKENQTKTNTKTPDDKPSQAEGERNDKAKGKKIPAEGKPSQAEGEQDKTDTIQKPK